MKTQRTFFVCCAPPVGLTSNAAKGLKSVRAPFALKCVETAHAIEAAGARGRRGVERVRRSEAPAQRGESKQKRAAPALLDRWRAQIDSAAESLPPLNHKTAKSPEK